MIRVQETEGTTARHEVGAILWGLVVTLFGFTTKSDHSVEKVRTHQQHRDLAHEHGLGEAADPSLILLPLSLLSLSSAFLSFLRAGFNYLKSQIWTYGKNLFTQVVNVLVVLPLPPPCSTPTPAPPRLARVM